MSKSIKIFFRLEQDDGGYPPVAAESLWGVPSTTAGEYVVDNIPFFVRDATMGDIIRARDEDGNPWFETLTQGSRNSLLRAVFFDEVRVEEVSRHLIGLGCSVEYSSSHKLLAINVPGEAKLTDVQAYLDSESARGALDYEEPILRQ